MSESSKNESKIRQMINDLTYECFNSGYPISIYCLIGSGSKSQAIKQVISPAALNYEGDTTTFYDLQNVMSGNFTTVPKQSKEEEEDPFEGI